MKILILLLCLLLTGCGQVYDGPTQEAQVLTGHSSYHDYDGKTDHVRYEYGYDTYGNEALVRYYLNDALSTETRKRYDAQGRLREAVSLYYGIENVTEVEDEHGQTTVVTNSRLLPQYTRAEYSYDALGRIQSVVNRNFWGVQQSQNTYVYDDLGGCTVNYAADGTVLQSYYQRTDTDELGRTVCQAYNDREDRYFYEDSEHWVRNEVWENGALTSTSLQELDDLGRPLHSFRLNDQGERVSTGHWEYTERMSVFYGEGGDRTENRYDEAGNLLSVERYNAQDEVTRVDIYTYSTIQIPAKEDAS